MPAHVADQLCASCRHELLLWELVRMPIINTMAAVDQALSTPQHSPSADPEPPPSQVMFTEAELQHPQLMAAASTASLLSYVPPVLGDA